MIRKPLSDIMQEKEEKEEEEKKKKILTRPAIIFLRQIKLEQVSKLDNRLSCIIRLKKFDVILKNKMGG